MRRKKKKLSDSGLYDLIEHPNDPNAWAIHILRGKFRGFVYSYGKTQIVENDEKTQATMVFELDILDIPDYMRDKKATEKERKRFYDLAHRILCEELELYFESKDEAEQLAAEGKEPIKFEYETDGSE